MSTENALPFDLEPDQDQQMVVDMLARFADERMRPLATGADLERKLPDGWLKEVAALALPVFNIPPSAGGSGSRLAVSGALVAETLARGDMAMALAALAPVSFVNALVDQATGEQCDRWLAPLVSEDFVAATVALAEPGISADPLQPATTARRDGSDWVLKGRKLAVPLGSSASLLLVSATDETGQPAGFVVEADSKGLTAQSERWMGLCALDLATIELDDVRVPADHRIGADDKPLDIRRLVSLGRVGIAAMATGVCQAVVDYCVPYCNERTAFGEPISHRQAVAFKLADAATETEAMRLLTWRAAGLAGDGGDGWRGIHSHGQPGAQLRRRPGHADRQRRRAAFGRARLYPRAPGGALVPQPAFGGGTADCHPGVKSASRPQLDDSKRN